MYIYKNTFCFRYKCQKTATDALNKGTGTTKSDDFMLLKVGRMR